MLEQPYSVTQTQNIYHMVKLEHLTEGTWQIAQLGPSAELLVHLKKRH